jgi:hypothetical protein
MAITASGLFGLSLEKILIDTLGQSLEAEDNNLWLLADAATPDFTTHDFRADLVANEVTGTNWAAGGVALTGTEVTLNTGTLTFDATDISVATTTISNAMAAVLSTSVGSDATDQLIGLWDFVTAVSTSAGTFGIQWNASGLFTLDYTP